MLNDFAVDPRYPGFAASIEQAWDAVKAARAIRRAVSEGSGDLKLVNDNAGE